MTFMKTHLPHGSAGFVEAKRFTFAELSPHEMPMDIGGKLGPITLAYETYGKLNREKSNAVLVEAPLSPGAHARRVSHRGGTRRRRSRGGGTS